MQETGNAARAASVGAAASSAAVQTADTARTATVPSTTPEAIASAPAAAITLEQFQQMMAAMPTRQGQQGQSQQALVAAQREMMLTTPGVLELLSSEAMTVALADTRVQAALPSLLEHLPAQDRDVTDIAQLLRCPPLRSQAAALTSALQSGQAAELIRSFELPGDAASPYGLRAFLDALIRLQRDSSQ